MKSATFRYQCIMFLIMVIVGITLNPMNFLAYRFNDLYLSLTLFYGGLLMASNMIWAHELVHYLSMKHMNVNIFLFGIMSSLAITFFLLRNQTFVNDEQWLRRMISHHSTALTSSHKIYERSSNERIKTLAKEIIMTQEREISEMKDMLA